MVFWVTNIPLQEQNHRPMNTPVLFSSTQGSIEEVYKVLHMNGKFGRGDRSINAIAI